MKETLNIQCPDYEDVSAFVDGELDSLSSEFTHIQSCDKCLKRVEEYRKLNSSINDILLSAVPEGFAENLLADIKKRQEQVPDKDSGKPIPFLLFMKVAAIFVVMGIVFFIFKNDDFSGGGLDPDTSDPLVFLDNPVPSRSFSKLEFPPTRENASLGSHSMDIRKLMNVSSGNYKDSDLFDFQDSSDCVACIQPKVSQVWSVDNLSDAEKEFAKFTDNSEFAKDENGNGVIVLKLTKKELAELVRKCKTAGFRLLSASQPQPEQITFSGNQNDKVCYTATLIQAE